MSPNIKQLLLLAASLCSLKNVSAMAPPHSLVSLTTTTSPLDIRGGASSSSSSSPPKKKKKKMKKNTGKANKVIDSAMKEKDAAEALGDAIR
jgi:hypothetical protein